MSLLRSQITMKLSPIKIRTLLVALEESSALPHTPKQQISREALWLALKAKERTLLERA